MKKYKIRIEYEEEVEAKDDEDAYNSFFEQIGNYGDTLGSFITDIMEITEVDELEELVENKVKEINEKQDEKNN